MSDVPVMPATVSDSVLPAIDGVVADVLRDKDQVYFNDYATLVQQQGMLQDHVRTSLYQFAILENAADFRGKTVVDVGAGTGILSFFAAQAGASRVYAVEASGMARYAKRLAEANNLGEVVSVINQRVEDVVLEEKVDVLISEPLGIALVNERMLESYLVARDNLLKPGGKMFPDRSVLYVAPFSDAALYAEQQQKLGFWTQSNFYGVDLTTLAPDAEKFYFSQPVVGPVLPGSLLSAPASLEFDFNTYTSISIYVHLYVSIYIHIMQTYIPKYIYIHACIYACIHTHVYIYRYTDIDMDR